MALIVGMALIDSLFRRSFTHAKQNNFSSLKLAIAVKGICQQGCFCQSLFFVACLIICRHNMFQNYLKICFRLLTIT